MIMTIELRKGKVTTNTYQEWIKVEHGYLHMPNVKIEKEALRKYFMRTSILITIIQTIVCGKGKQDLNNILDKFKNCLIEKKNSSVGRRIIIHSSNYKDKINSRYCEKYGKFNGTL